jgi:hypothetical protein
MHSPPYPHFAPRIRSRITHLRAVPGRNNDEVALLPTLSQRLQQQHSLRSDRNEHDDNVSHLSGLLYLPLSHAGMILPAARIVPVPVASDSRVTSLVSSQSSVEPNSWLPMFV